MSSKEQPSAVKMVDSERAPLLAKKRVPIDKLQLLFVCTWRASMPIQYTVIFPYICQYIEEMGIVEAGGAVGPIAAYVETSASVGCYIGMVFWTLASDRYGRKPTILVAIMTAALATSLFGFSTKLWHMLTFRFLLGLFNGQMSIARVLLIESSHPSNLAASIPYFSLGWQIGGTIGPALGGLLSKPADNWKLAQTMPWLVKYPYALPSIVAALIPASFVPWAIWKMKETHPRYKKIKPECPAHSPVSSSQADPKAEPQIAQRKTFLTAHILFFFLLWTSMQIINGFIMQAVMLLAYADESIGGLNLLPAQTASLLMARTVLIPALELPFFAKFNGRWGSDRMLRRFICLPIALPVLLPILAKIKSASGFSPAFYVVLFLFLMIWVVWNLTSVTCGMLMADLPQRQEDLGKVAAISEVVANIGLPVGLLLAGNVFAWSKEHAEVLDGNAIWLFATVLFFGIAMLGQYWQSIPGWRAEVGQQAS